MSRTLALALVLVPLVLVVALGACASPAPRAVPTPYTAEEIRAANPEGTELLYRVSAEGAPAPVEQRMRFVVSDERGAVVETVTSGPDGSPGEPQRSPHTPWEELRDHAAFPPGLASRERGVVEVPAGRFPAWIYTVNDGETVVEYAFALEHAGPPVRILARRGGTRVMLMELVEGR